MEYVRKISSGQSGEVILINDVERNRYCALKRIRKKGTTLKIGSRIIELTLEDVRLLWEEEVEFLKRLNEFHSGYFPEYFNSYEDEEYFNIMMEYVSGITLREKIFEMNKEEYVECDFFVFIWQVCDIFILLAENDLIYLDMNLDNFIVTEGNTVKLIDFGLSCGTKVVSCNSDIVKLIYGEEKDKITMLMGIEKTIAYMSNAPMGCGLKFDAYENIQLEVIMSLGYKLMDVSEMRKTMRKFSYKEHIEYLRRMGDYFKGLKIVKKN